MRLLDFILGNKKEKQRLERERLAELERQHKAEEARIAKEREARLAENRRKEAERQARLKVEAPSSFEGTSRKTEIGKTRCGIIKRLRVASL